MSRAGPAPSVSFECRACGSHLAHSHSTRFSGATQKAITKSCGVCRTASCPSSARTVDRTFSRSPRNRIRAQARRKIAMGWSGTVE